MIYTHDMFQGTHLSIKTELTAYRNIIHSLCYSISTFPILQSEVYMGDEPCVE
jgi:hypothetical protein